MRKLCVLMLALCGIYSAQAQLAAWDFTGESNQLSSVADLSAPNLAVPVLLTRGSSAGPSAGANSFRTTGFQNDGIATSNSDYFQFSMTALPGHILSITSINARFSGTASFAASPGVSAQFAYSLDGINFTLAGSPFLITGASGIMPVLDLSAVAQLQSIPGGTTVFFRYYASGQTTTGGWGFSSSSAGLYGLSVEGSILPVTGAGSNNSRIIHDDTFIPASDINYLHYQGPDIELSNSIEVARFIIQDGGGQDDSDASGTILTALNLSVSNSGSIDRIAIYDGPTKLGETAAAGSISFGSLGLGTSDNGSRNFSIRVVYKSIVTDNEQSIFTVVSATADPAGSGFALADASGASSSSQGNHNRIEVSADRLRFQQPPSNTGVGNEMTPSVLVAAVDQKENLDTDFNTGIQISSSGSLSGGMSLSTVVNGIAGFPGLIHNTAGTNLTLNAKRAGTGDWEVSSTAFDIVATSGASDHFRSKSSGSWSAASSWQSSPDSINWADATIPPTNTAASTVIRSGHELTISVPTSANRLLIETGSTLIVGANFTLADRQGTDLEARGIVINNAGTFSAAGTFIEFKAGSLYRHNRNGGPVWLCSWDPSSTVEFTGITTAAPSQLNQNFGHVVWNAVNQAQTVNLGGALNSVAGNFVVTSTSAIAGRYLRLFSNTTNARMDIGGDFIIQGPDGKLEFSNGSATNTALHVAGSFLVQGRFNANVASLLEIRLSGNNKRLSVSTAFNPASIQWNIPTGSSVSLESDLSLGAGPAMKIEGRLHADTFRLTGMGNLTVNGTFTTHHPNGLAASFSHTGGTSLGDNSTIGFTSSSGLQELTGRLDYQHVEISGGTKKVEGSALINGVLTLGSRIQTRNAGTLALSSQASIAGASSDYYIDGPLTMKTNSAGQYGFPVGGPASYRPIFIKPVSSEESSFTVEYLDLTPGGPICASPNLKGYTSNGAWRVERMDAGANAQIGISYARAAAAGSWTNGSLPIADPDGGSRITLGRYTGSCWQDENWLPGMLPGAADSGQVSSGTTGAFGYFTFAQVGIAVLPVSFSAIKATEQAGGIAVEWNNDTEIDVSYYQVERSGDGIGFKTIYQVAARENNGAKVHYSFLDTDPAGDNYYRIRSVETSGKITHSGIVRIATRLNSSFLAISPNPADGNELRFYTAEIPAGKYHIAIYNSLGQKIERLNIQHPGGRMRERIRFQARPGIYLIIVEGGLSLQKQFMVR
ncbi:MAG TPA: T9SS type A sorting domain-containing protein [Flavisolibacter sp.]|nr:T9SS type A sorting domain-containing protein [Flavisolibacter sp.]